MSTLTTTHSAFAPAARSARAKTSFWRRAYEAFAAAQQRRAEREIARYLAAHGGVLTDEMEREVMSRLAGTSNKR